MVKPKTHRAAFLARIGSVAATAALGALLLLTTAPAPAVRAADTASPLDDGMDDVDSSAVSTYTVVPSKGQVQVSVVQRLTNWIPSTSEPYSCVDYYWDPYWGYMPYESTCYRTTNYYIDTAYLLVENEAVGLKVTTNGGSVKVTRTSSSANFTGYKLTFPHTFNGKTRALTATYRIPSGTPRSSDDIRINSAYLNFWAIGQEADATTIRIQVPKAYGVDPYVGSGGVLTTTDSATQHVYTDVVSDTSGLYVGVSGTNPNGFTERTMATPDGRTIDFQGWPDDPAWMTAVTGEAAASLATIERLIGQPLPGSGSIIVREVAGSSLGDAYIGAYDPTSSTATISEDFSQAGTVTHELAHAWFNQSLFDAHWMAEGYAQWMERAAGANTTPCVAPSSYPGTGSPSLGDWTYANPGASDTTFAIVGYEYDASCWIVSDLASRIGVDRMRDVIRVLATSDAAYPGTSDAKAGTPADWKAWLDAVDEAGMLAAGLEDTHTEADILVRYGIATTAALAGRAEARAALDSLRTEANAWRVPTAVLGPMAAWQFDGAEAAMTEFEAIRTALADVHAALPEVSVEGSPIRAAAEAATSLSDLQAVDQKVTAQAAAARAVAEAESAYRAAAEPLQQIGLAGTDIPALSADGVAAVRSFDFGTANATAARIQSMVAGASSVGLQRVVAAVALALVVLVVVAFIIRRRRRRRAALAAAASSGEAPSIPESQMEPGLAATSIAETTGGQVPSGPMNDVAGAATTSA